jgi:hypothetical protein
MIIVALIAYLSYERFRECQDLGDHTAISVAGVDPPSGRVRAEGKEHMSEEEYANRKKMEETEWLTSVSRLAPRTRR